MKESSQLMKYINGETQACENEMKTVMKILKSGEI